MSVLIVDAMSFLVCLLILMLLTLSQKYSSSSSVSLSHHIHITTHLSSTHIFHYYQQYYSPPSNPPYHRSIHTHTHTHHHHHQYLHVISLSHSGSNVLHCLLSDFTVMFKIKKLQAMIHLESISLCCRSFISYLINV